MKSILLNAQGNMTQSYVVTEPTQYIVKTFSGSNLNLTLIFEKSGVNAEVISLTKLKETEEAVLETITDHRVPNTACNTYVKTVLDGASKSKYTGRILIKKPAQQTSSFLETNTLVLGDKTQNNSQPILEIEADDVKASHGSTTGRIDSAQVYYLQSRGFTKREAEELLIEGFFAETLNKIYDPTIRQELALSLGITL